MMRTFLVKRVMKPRRTAKTRPTRVPPILTMRKDAAEEAESSQYSRHTKFGADPDTSELNLDTWSW